MTTEVLHTLRQASPVVASYILHTYSTPKTRELTLVQSTALNSISPVLHALVCSVLHNFIAGADFYHHDQDTELFHHHKGTALCCPLYSQLTLLRPHC